MYRLSNHIISLFIAMILPTPSSCWVTAILCELSFKFWLVLHNICTLLYYYVSSSIHHVHVIIINWNKVWCHYVTRYASFDKSNHFSVWKLSLISNFNSCIDQFWQITQFDCVWSPHHMGKSNKIMTVIGQKKALAKGKIGQVQGFSCQSH